MGFEFGSKGMVHDSSNLIDPGTGTWTGVGNCPSGLRPTQRQGLYFGNPVVNCFGNPGLERQGLARLGTRIRELDLPLSADIQGECGNPSPREFTTGIWLKPDC